MKKEKIKVVHFTTGHPRNELRVHLKQCNSLVENGNFEVTLVVCDGKGDDLENDLKIIDVGTKGSRAIRIFLRPFQVLNKVSKLQADIYHFHDPELIPVGYFLSLAKKAKIVFDSHENVGDSLLTREWLQRNFVEWSHRRINILSVNV